MMIKNEDEIVKEFRTLLQDQTESRVFHMLDRMLSAVIDNGIDEGIICPQINKFVMERI